MWHGLYAPKPEVDRFSSALQYPLADSAVKQRFGDLGAEPVGQNRATPGALRSHLKSEVGKWAPIMKEAGVYAD